MKKLVNVFLLIVAGFRKRNSTEWVELVDNGWNTLVGADSKKIITAVNNISKPTEVPALYGKGDCAKLIVDELLK